MTTYAFVRRRAARQLDTVADHDCSSFTYANPDDSYHRVCVAPPRAAFGSKESAGWRRGSES